MSSVLIRDEDWNYAYIIGKWVKTASDLGRTMGIEGDADKLIQCVDCQMCKAPPGAACRTLTSGGPARQPHKCRILLFIAVTNAVANEIVIVEEDCIEDLI